MQQHLKFGNAGEIPAKAGAQPVEIRAQRSRFKLWMATATITYNRFSRRLVKSACLGLARIGLARCKILWVENPLGQEVVPPQQDMSPDIEPRVDQATLQEKIKTHPPTIQILASYKGLVQHTLTR